jgi:hypothetical protein
MEANTLTHFLFFIPKVEENNDGAKENDSNPIDFIVAMIENCL